MSPVRHIERASTSAGVALGPLLAGVLEDKGLVPQTFVWDYGAYPRVHPFEPHVDLDGVEFANFDDDVLVNNDTFPDGTHYLPGDHDGCRCDFAPAQWRPPPREDLLGPAQALVERAMQRNRAALPPTTQAAQPDVDVDRDRDSDEDQERPRRRRRGQQSDTEQS